MRWLLALVALVPLSASADAGAAIERLLVEDSLPTTRARLVAEACAEPVTPEQVRPLFRTDARTPPLDGTQLLVCRSDPALIPIMFEEFARSSLGAGLRADPDIFERLLRALQRFPIETLRERLAEADQDLLVDGLHARFVGNWLQALSPDPEAPLLQELPEELRRRVQGAVRGFIDELLALGPDGLVMLQIDSGGGLRAVEERIQFEYAAWLIERGEGDEVTAGIELARQLPGRSPRPREALLARLARDPDPALRERLADLPASAAAPLRPDAHLYPVGPIDPTLPEGTWEAPPGRRPPSLRATAGVFALVLLAGALFALRRWPRSRGVLFPVGAALLPFAGLLALESLLAVAGVEPLADRRPSLDPNQVGGARYDQIDLEGVPHLVSGAGDHRYEAFRLPKPEGLRRVVFLGESSVHGTHYLREETFVSRVGEALGDDVEALNVGIGGALTDEIARLGLRALAWEPDLLVVYCGYNDLTHIPFMERYRGVDLRGMALRAELGRWRLVRVLHDLLPEGVFALGPGAEPAYLDDRDADGVALSRLTEFAQGNAVANLRRLSVGARRAGVPLLVVTQATNEVSCYFGLEGEARLEAGCLRQELASIAEEVAAIGGHPRLDAAAMMRAAAANYGDLEAAETWQPLFWDGVHPTRLGHALLAEAMAPVIGDLLGD